jgi:hypothetical protein
VTGPDRAHAGATERIAAWLDLMDACEQLLLAGLRYRLGPGADIEAAHRQWCTEQMKEDDHKIEALMNAYNQRSRWAWLARSSFSPWKIFGRPWSL